MVAVKYFMVKLFSCSSKVLSLGVEEEVGAAIGILFKVLWQLRFYAKSLNNVYVLAHSLAIFRALVPV